MPSKREIEAAAIELALQEGKIIKIKSGNCFVYDKTLFKEYSSRVETILEAAERAKTIEKAMQQIESGDYEDVTDTVFD